MDRKIETKNVAGKTKIMCTKRWNGMQYIMDSMIRIHPHQDESRKEVFLSRRGRNKVNGMFKISVLSSPSVRFQVIMKTFQLESGWYRYGTVKFKQPLGTRW